MKIVETINLTKFYRRRKAIENVNLQVEENAIYGFLGCNGAGKTTTLSIISGLVRKTSGRISVNGLDLDSSSSEIKQITGIMLQNMELYSNKTAYNNMLFYAKLKGMNKEHAIKEIDFLFKEFDIENIKKIKARELSHGQAKTLLIMQTFLNNPKLVILDEPIAGFDPKRIILLREYLMKKRKETTILLSSHNLDEVDRLCTHIGIIHDGKIILQGLKERIKGRKTLERVFIEHI